MFAVPGWSVFASKLKAQEELKSKETAPTINGSDKPAKEERSSKKRKRDHGKVNGTIVTKDNVAELWQRYVEGKGVPQVAEVAAKPEKSKKRRRRKHREDGPIDSGKEGSVQDIQDESSLLDTAGSKHNDSKELSQAPEDSPPPLQDGKSKYEQRKFKAEQKALIHSSGTLPPPRPPISTSSKSPQLSTKPIPPQSSIKSTVATIIPVPPPIPRNHAKLTPLQTAMRAKLISARFRHINQTLYTTPSTHASSLFSSNPEAFASYHAGFRAQVASWPQNPVEIFVREIKERGAAAGPKSQKQLFKEQKKKGGKKDKGKSPVEANMETGVKLDPLPRSATTKTSTITDLGCGDASLHASLLPYVSSLSLSLQSYDLSPGDTRNAYLITVSDIAHLPLADSSVDVAIFCLALMGTNWVDFVAEAARVVRVGGECWVGEVRSRFVGAKDMQRAKSLKGVNKEKKKVKKEGEDDDEMMGTGKMEVEEEEVAGKKLKEQETDVGPFVDVFRRRGFALKGDVDLENKMFVRLRFVRVRNASNAGSMNERRGQQQSSRLIDKVDEAAIEAEEEAKVLKPCLYKTR